jgi:HEAT repeat protein
MVIKDKNNEHSARVAAVTLLSSDKSSLTNRQLLAALYDKDYFVRAAAARGLGDFHNPETAEGLLVAFDDEKPLVRFMAAAGYIRCTMQSRNDNPSRHSGHLKRFATSSVGEIPPADNTAPTVPSQPHK